MSDMDIDKIIENLAMFDDNICCDYEECPIYHTEFKACKDGEEVSPSTFLKLLATAVSPFCSLTVQTHTWLVGATLTMTISSTIFSSFYLFSLQ